MQMIIISPTSSTKKWAISATSCKSCKFCARLIALTTSSAVVLASNLCTFSECNRWTVVIVVVFVSPSLLGCILVLSGAFDWSMGVVYGSVDVRYWRDAKSCFLRDLWLRALTRRCCFKTASGCCDLDFVLLFICGCVAVFLYGGIELWWTIILCEMKRSCEQLIKPLKILLAPIRAQLSEHPFFCTAGQTANHSKQQLVIQQKTRWEQLASSSKQIQIWNGGAQWFKWFAQTQRTSITVVTSNQAAAKASHQQRTSSRQTRPSSSS